MTSLFPFFVLLNSLRIHTFMPTPEDIQQAEELAFNLFQIPAAVLYGISSAFSQNMPLTTKSYTDTFLLARLYALVALVIYIFLLGDAVVKVIRMFRLMILGRLRPWGCIVRVMGFVEIKKGVDAVHEDVLCIRVPLTGFVMQIIIMLGIDLAVAFTLSLFWIGWIPFVFVVMILSRTSPKSYYEHLCSIKNKYEGVPHTAGSAVLDECDTEHEETEEKEEDKEEEDKESEEEENMGSEEN